MVRAFWCARAAAARYPARLGGRLNGRTNLDIDFPAGTSSDCEDEFRPARCELAGRFRKADSRRANHTVETLVAEPYRIAVHGGLESQTAVPASRPPHLEHVAEVGSEVEGEGHYRLDLSEVGKDYPLIEPHTPQEARALDMNDALRRCWAPQHWQGSVGEMCGEAHIVLAH
jgi:hypothetical protein